MYGAARDSTRSPAKQIPSSGSQTTRSPAVWPRPRWRSSTTRLPRSMRQRVVEGDGRPREARNGLGTGEQARHAALLAGPVGHPPLLDERRRPRVGHDAARPEGGCPERPHGVVVGQDQVAEGQVADPLAHDVDPSLRHHRGGARLDGEDRIGPHDASDVRVALRGEGEDPVGQLLEGGLLGVEVRRRGERLRHRL